MPYDAKALGAYFTPEGVAEALVQWAVRDPGDLLLDPSSGDGRFVARHPNSVGIEQDPASVAEASDRAPNATVVQGDFFTWASDDRRRFDCAVGNPPFIRYQRFSGATRRAALEYCRRFGVTFSGLSSSWAPFIVAAASKLRDGGRVAFVVPAEIGHAPYATPLMEYLVTKLRFRASGRHQGEDLPAALGGLLAAVRRQRRLPRGRHPVLEARTIHLGRDAANGCRS